MCMVGTGTRRRPVCVCVVPGRRGEARQRGGAEEYAKGGVGRGVVGRGSGEGKESMKGRGEAGQGWGGSHLRMDALDSGK